MTTAALTTRATARELVATFQAAERDVRAAFASIRAAEVALERDFGRGGVEIAIARSARLCWDKPERVIADMRRDAWRTLAERLELQRMMSVQRWTDLCRDLESKEPPPVTEETVFGMLDGVTAALPEMLTEAVREVFDWLRPPGSPYKRNSEWEVPARVVLTRIVEPWGRIWSGWRMAYYGNASQHLRALENVFAALDGRGTVNRGHYSEIETIIRTGSNDANAGGPRFDGHGETRYFRFRTFKNGNMHLDFLRPDLLARLNQIAGGARLRGAA